MPEHAYKSIEPVLAKAGMLSASTGDKSLKDLSITGMSSISNEVKEGFAFFAIVGEKTDGNKFIGEAIARGAACIFSVQAPDNCSVPHIRVKDIKEATAQLAAYLYDYPSKRLRLIGVTGTNGKTSVTHLIEHVLNKCGRKTGLIGTLGTRLPDASGYQPVKHTTPQAYDLQHLFSDMLNTKVSHVAMEVSSHALSLKRVECCEFAIACLTNVTQDHLDFHTTMENYARAKRLLFEELNNSTQKNKAAIVNLDDAQSEKFLQVLNKDIKQITFGWQKGDINIAKAEFELGKSKLELNTPQGQLTLELRLAGRFMAYNVMTALAVCLAEGVTLKEFKAAIEDFTGVPGRFQIVDNGQKAGPVCVVDYAHTPDALDKVLRTAREIVPAGGKLIAVFGCGGDRDPSKRPLMGEIAETLADDVIVTSDNPRSENPMTIIANILVGTRHTAHVKVEADRAAAIEMAVMQAAAKDVIVVAGKGHEDYQILGDKKIHFDDREQLLGSLNKRSMCQQK